MSRSSSQVHMTSAAMTVFVVILVCSFGVKAQGLEVNQQPLREFAKVAQSRIDSKQLDIKKPFSLEMAAVITEDGRLDKNASRFTTQSGDPKMVETAKEAVMALGETGYFGYLKQLGIDHARLSISQTTDSFAANVLGEQNSFRARMTAAALNMMIPVAAGRENAPPNEKILLQNTRASVSEGGVNINCTLPAADFQRMILGNKTATAGPIQ